MATTPARSSDVRRNGVIFIHACPHALASHVEWAIGRVLDDPHLRFDWTDQPILPGTKRVEISWVGTAGSGSRMASELKAFPGLRFEVTEDASGIDEGERYSFTPELGMHAACIGPSGDVQIGEERLKAVMSRASGETDLREGLRNLLGQPWDDALEPFRYAGEGTPVRWLHRVG